MKTSEIYKDIVRGMAEQMEPDKLHEQYNKTQNSDIKDEVEDVIMERRMCPNCENELMMDESSMTMYCPICPDYEFEV